MTEKTAAEYVRDAKRDEKEEKQKRALDMWLDCATQQEIADAIDVPRKTVADWVADSQFIRNSPPPSRQHFDVWQFATTDKEGGGRAHSSEWRSAQR